jgi:hypothetical protein
VTAAASGVPAGKACQQLVKHVRYLELVCCEGMTRAGSAAASGVPAIGVSRVTHRYLELVCCEGMTRDGSSLWRASYRRVPRNALDIERLEGLEAGGGGECIERRHVLVI